MKLLIPYPGLASTIGYLVKQARESVPQIPDYVPSYIHDPEALFYFLKGITSYRNDPAGREYIPTVRTLFEKNGGAGDCDDLTVLALAALKECCDINANIVLVGYNRLLAKHIYTNFRIGGKLITFDLTNPYYNFERDGGPTGKKYKFFQDVKVRL